MQFKNIVSALFLKDSWQNIKPCDVLLVRHDFDCGYTFQNKAYSPILDSIADRLSEHGMNCQAIAIPYSQLIGAKAHYSPIAINRFFFKTAIFTYLFKIFLGRKIAYIWKKQKRESFWGYLLKKTCAKFVLSIGSDQELISACKKQNVFFYEVQHGLISQNIDIIQYLRTKNNEGKPLGNGFLCWDQASAKHFQTLKIENYDIRIIGNPWVLRHFYNAPQDLLVQNGKKQLRNLGLLTSGKPNILVTLQWGMKKFYSIPNDVMPECLEETILDTANTYNWLIRLHPVTLRGYKKNKVLSYLKKKFGNLPTVEWENSTKLSLPILLASTDLHITFSSSVVIEATWFGVFSAVLNPLANSQEVWGDAFIEQINLGLAKIISQDSFKIKQWISENLNDNRRQLRNLHLEQESFNEFINHIQIIARNKK